MHITPDFENPGNVAFIFCQSFAPFDELNIDRVKHKQGNFECAMLVNDLRDKEHVNPDEFYIVMFTKNEESKPNIILKFTRPIGSFRLDPLRQWSIEPFKVP